MLTFDLMVEGKSDDPYVVAGPLLHLVRLEWDGDSPPDIVRVGSIQLVKVGKYLAPGETYSYRVATVGSVVEGRLLAAGTGLRQYAAIPYPPLAGSANSDK